MMMKRMMMALWWWWWCCCCCCGDVLWWWWWEKMVMAKHNYDEVCWQQFFGVCAGFVSWWSLNCVAVVWWPFGGVSKVPWQCSVMFWVSCSCLGGVSVVSWRCSGVVSSWYLRKDIFWLNWPACQYQIGVKGLKRDTLLLGLYAGLLPSSVWGQTRYNLKTNVLCNQRSVWCFFDRSLNRTRSGAFSSMCFFAGGKGSFTTPGLSICKALERAWPKQYWEEFPPVSGRSEMQDAIAKKSRCDKMRVFLYY